MMKRIAAALLALSVSMLLLAGCGGEPAPSAAASASVSAGQAAPEKQEEEKGKVPGSGKKAEPDAAAESVPEESSASAVPSEQPAAQPAETPESQPAPAAESQPAAEPPVMEFSEEGTTKVVTLDRLPATLKEFEAIAEDLSRPEATCTLFLCAAELYLSDADDGVAAMDVLRGPRPMAPYDVQFLRDRLRDKKYLPKAYFEGAAPDNNYTPEEPFVLKVLPDPRPQDIEKGYLRVYLQTTGADSPRPIKLREKDGSWYLWEYSSILSGIRIPAEEDAWA